MWSTWSWVVPHWLPTPSMSPQRHSPSFQVRADRRQASRDISRPHVGVDMNVVS